MEQDLDKRSGLGEFILGDIVADLPDESVIPAGRKGEGLLQHVGMLFGRNDAGVVPLHLVLVAADRQVIGILAPGGKGPVQELERDIGRVEILSKIIGFADKQIEIVDPVIAGIMDEDAGSGFVNNGIEVAFLCGGGVEAVVVKGKQARIVFPVAGFGAGDDQFQLLVRVEIVVIVGDGVLDEAAAFFEFFAVIGVFGGQDAVFEFFGFDQVIVHAYLGRNGQVTAREYP